MEVDLMSSDEEDDDFGKPVFCFRVRDMFVYLLYAGRIEEREKIDAFSGLSFSTRCPCCFQKFKFKVERGLKDHSNELFLSITEPSGVLHGVLKYVDQPINADNICHFDPVL